jgi:hypothetical protein
LKTARLRHATSLLASSLLVGVTPTQADAPTASPERIMLMNGWIGHIHIGMMLSDLQSTLGRPLPPEDVANMPVKVDFTNSGDLRALGLNQVAGFASYSAYLVFGSQVGRDWPLRSVTVGLNCDDLPEIAKALGAWSDNMPDSPFAWGLQGLPGCHLTLWRP